MPEAATPWGTAPYPPLTLPPAPLGAPSPAHPMGRGTQPRQPPRSPTSPSSCPHKQLSYTTQPTPAAPSGSDLWSEPPALLNQLINPQLLPAMVKGQSNRKKAHAAYPKNTPKPPHRPPLTLAGGPQGVGAGSAGGPQSSTTFPCPLMLTFCPPPSASSPQGAARPGGAPCPIPSSLGASTGSYGGACVNPAANGSKQPRVWER